MTRQNRNGTCGCERLEPRQFFSADLTGAQAMSLAYGSDGTPHVAYYDAAEHDLKYITRGPDGKWAAPIIVDASSADAGEEPVLALDPAGGPGIAYLDAGGSLKYAHLTGGAWTIAVIDPHNAGPHPSLTFDAAGEPIVSFYRPSSGALELAELHDSQWKLRQVAKVGGADHAGSALAVNPADGTVGIAYQSVNGTMQYLAQVPAPDGHVGLAVTARFHRYAVERLGQGAADPALTFDPSGLPALAYYDLANGQLRLTRDVDGFWQPASITASTGHSGAPQVTFSSGSDVPQVVFSAAAGSRFVATVTGNGVQVTGAPPVNSSINLSPSPTVVTAPAAPAPTNTPAPTVTTPDQTGVPAEGANVNGTTVPAAPSAPTPVPSPAAPAAPTPTPAPADPNRIVPVYFDAGVSATDRAGQQFLGYWLGGGGSPDWRAMGINELARSYEIPPLTGVPSQDQLNAWADHLSVDGENVPGVYDLEWGQEMQPGQIAAQVAIVQASKIRHPNQPIGVAGNIDLTDPRASALAKLLDFGVAGPYLCTYSGGAGTADPVYNLAHTTDAQYMANYQSLLDQQLAQIKQALPGKPAYVYLPDMWNDSFTPIRSSLLQQMCNLLLDYYKQGKIAAIIAYAGYNTPTGFGVWDPTVGGTYMDDLNAIAAGPKFDVGSLNLATGVVAAAKASP